MAFVFNRRYDEATEVRLMVFFATLSEKDRRRYVLRTRPQISYPIFFSLTLPSPRYSCCAGRGEGTGNR